MKHFFYLLLFCLISCCSAMEVEPAGSEIDLPGCVVQEEVDESFLSWTQDQESQSVCAFSSGSGRLYDVYKLVCANDEDKTKELESLLDVNPNAARSVDGEMNMALHYAAFSGKLKYMKLLIDAIERVERVAKIYELSSSERISFINNYNLDGCTPLHLAIQKGHTDCACILIQNGADPSLKDADERNVLHIASFCGWVECVCVLLSVGGINVLEVDKDHKTALRLAVENEHKECAQLLFDFYMKNQINIPRDLKQALAVLGVKKAKKICVVQ